MSGRRFGLGLAASLGLTAVLLAVAGFGPAEWRLGLAVGALAGLVLSFAAALVQRRCWQYPGVEPVLAAIGLGFLLRLLGLGVVTLGFALAAPAQAPAALFAVAVVVVVASICDAVTLARHCMPAQESPGA